MKPILKPHNKYLYELVGDFWCELKPTTILIKSGFPTDGASIPRFLRWFSDPFSPDTIGGAIVHDALYQSKILPRKNADKIFLRKMKLDNVEWFKRYSFYLAVRCFGWVVYKNRSKNKKFVEIIYAKENVK